MEWSQEQRKTTNVRGSTQSVRSENVHPPRKILAVVTVGRYTCAAPLIEICRVLHSRGHEIQFAVLKGWEKLVAPHAFVSKVHLVGRDLTVAEDDELYRLLDASVVTSAAGRRSMAAGIRFIMQWWPETFEKIKQVCIAERPDFLLSDLLADASVDVARELDIPLAMHYPQMPIQMLPSPYIPGLPGMQLKHLTSEHASLWERMMEEYSALRLTLSMVPYIVQRRRHRAAAGLRRPTGRPPAKPDYLVLVNSFFGLEVAKDLPPLVRAIGPVLSDEYPDVPPESPLAAFLASHRRILYVSFGTHMETPGWRKRRMVEGMQQAMQEGDIDGVVWAMKKPVDEKRRAGSDLMIREGRNVNKTPQNAAFDIGATDKDSDILAGQHPDWLLAHWVPQRAVLAHPATALYLTHCGASSTMEAAFHGVPVLAMPICADQLGNGRRLAAAGVGVYLDKNTFSARDLAAGIAAIVRDDGHEYGHGHGEGYGEGELGNRKRGPGSFARNVLRIRRVAHVCAARGKVVAASLVEETMYDRELAREEEEEEEEEKAREARGSLNERGRRRRRPFHLQTCDARMAWIRRTNWDVWVLFPFCLPLLVIYSWIWRT